MKKAFSWASFCSNRCISRLWIKMFSFDLNCFSRVSVKSCDLSGVAIHTYINYYFHRSFPSIFPQYIYRGLFTPFPAPWQLNNTQSDCGAAAFWFSSEWKIYRCMPVDTVSLYGDAMTLMTEREILQCTIPFCSGNGHDRSCSDNDTSAERRPGETRGGTGKSLIHVPAGRFGVW